MFRLWLYCIDFDGEKYFFGGVGGHALNIVYLFVGIGKKLKATVKTKECEKLKKWLPMIKKTNILDRSFISLWAWKNC